MSLINTIWWLFTLNFGLRGRREHHSMTVSDFQFKKGHFGNEFVKFVEGIRKTRQSDLHEKHRLILPKMFSADTSRYPVNIFKLYLSKRPSQLRSSGPFYLSIIHKPVSNSLWNKHGNKFSKSVYLYRASKTGVCGGFGSLNEFRWID